MYTIFGVRLEFSSVVCNTVADKGSHIHLSTHAIHSAVSYVHVLWINCTLPFVCNSQCSQYTPVASNYVYLYLYLSFRIGRYKVVECHQPCQNMHIPRL